MSETSSYKTIAKNTAIVGSAQIVQMLASLARNKVASVLLGTAGMGLNALIFSAISVVQQFASFGIFQSGVREIASVRENPDKLASTVKVFRLLSVLCGILGVIACIALSPVLSRISIGDGSYTWYFIGASATLLFMALQSRSNTIMQATGNLRLLAMASIAGVTINLLVSVALFYFFGINGVVPAIVVGYLGFYGASRYFERRITFAPYTPISRQETVKTIKPMLQQGSAIMLSQLLMTLFAFLLNGFISNMNSVDDVGLFQAAASICVQSMSVITMTLASDYFPRLSAANGDQSSVGHIVNNQAEIMMLIVAPISLFIVIAAPLIIRILMAPEFMVVAPILRIMALSFIFRAIWNVLGFIPLSKSDNKTYFVYDAIVGHGGGFLLNIVAFYLWGLTGLGISYLISAIFMFALLSGVAAGKYKVRLKRSVIQLLIILSLVSALTFLSSTMLKGGIAYIVSGSLFITTAIYCYIKLDKYIKFKEFTKRRFKS